LLNLDEREFMSACQATFKLGISFENWGEIGDRYIHSFGQIGKSTWLGASTTSGFRPGRKGLAATWATIAWSSRPPSRTGSIPTRTRR
jgi:hypothetical protein